MLRRRSKQRGKGKVGSKEAKQRWATAVGGVGKLRRIHKKAKRSGQRRAKQRKRRRRRKKMLLFIELEAWCS